MNNNKKIRELIKYGHTKICAKQMVLENKECNCGKEWYSKHLEKLRGTK